jgi:hypothetical protein
LILIESEGRQGYDNQALRVRILGSQLIGRHLFMQNEHATTAAKDRSDLSDYIVHLCRDDSKSFSNGSPARDNFVTIATEKKIRAFKPHCLFVKAIKELGKELRKVVQAELSVSCYTEAPLEQIKYLVGRIKGRQYCFEPYGLVFKKDYILQSGGQPAFNINAYGPEKSVRQAAWDLFSHCTADGRFRPKLSPLLPFINQMATGYDFAWEREWRIKGDLKFKPSDVFCVIVPNRDQKLREAIHKKGIPCIDPLDSETTIDGELQHFDRTR